MVSKEYQVPSLGEIISIQNGKLTVPPNPIIPFIEGDGIGKDVWPAARSVLDAAVAKAFSAQRCIHWMEVLAGEKALAQKGSLLPLETIRSFADFRVGIKGPLTTPISEGFRSLNVTLRHELDLYACIRPIRWIPGVPSPVRNPDKVDMVIFRENIEDLYAGIEFKNGSESNQQFQTWLKVAEPEEFAKIRFPETTAFSIKPISRQGTERLVRAAISYALINHRTRVTLVHKGNIMKHTEGAFLDWGMALAEREFGDDVYTHRQFERSNSNFDLDFANQERSAAISEGKLLLNDVITDAAFEQTLTRPEEFDVIATMNLNGDYLSDALSAQIGGLGIAPGANVNAEEHTALFEATHGTAPDLAGKNCANPCSLILSGAMMLRHLGWHEAADLVESGIQRVVAAKTVTFDFQRLIPDARVLTTSAFAQEVINNLAAQDKPDPTNSRSIS